AWRTRDFERDKKIIHYAVTSPINLEQAEIDAIWKKNIEDNYNICIKLKNTKERCDFKKGLMEKQLAKHRYFPEMWDIIAYLQQNSSKIQGKFTLTGNNSPKEKFVKLG